MAYSSNRKRFSMSFDSSIYESLKKRCCDDNISIAKFVEDCVCKQLDSNCCYSRVDLIRSIRELRNCLNNMYKIIKQTKSI